MKEQSKKNNTEERILSAAKAVFTSKGFHATTTRDIAEAADITLSSLHYYFRSKEKLFDIVASQAMQEFAKVMITSFQKNIPFHEKIRLSVIQFIDLYKENPLLPFFIINETEKNPEKVYNFVNFEETDQQIKKEVQALIDQGLIRPMIPQNFLENLVGLTIIPFLTRNMRHHKENRDEQAFNEMLEERKTIVPAMLINHMYYQPPV